MNVAIVHDSLIEFGGAERVLQVLTELFPNTHIYTAFADPSFRKAYLPTVPPQRFHTSFLQPLHIDVHTSLFQAISPFVWRHFNLARFDLVISNSFHLMSNLVRVPRGVHIACLQTPPKNIFGIDPPTPLQRLIHYDTYIRPLYTSSLARLRHVVVGSKHIQTSLRTRVGVASTVIYPPVIIPKRPPKQPKGKFFLCISRIVPYKHLELPILAANALRAPLKIIGAAFSPSYERHLRSLAGPTVEFLGFQNDLEKYYADSVAFLFPTYNEDFGIAPLEATAHGVPVVAHWSGGVKETVIEGKTGTFFHALSVPALIEAMKRVRGMRFRPETLYRHAQTFSTDHFKREFMAYVNKVIRSTRVERSGRSG